MMHMKSIYYRQNIIMTIIDMVQEKNTTKQKVGVNMTKEEAFKTIKENLCGMCAYGSQCMESCDIRSCDNRDAIKALEQEACEDCISRQAAIDALENTKEVAR